MVRALLAAAAVAVYFSYAAWPGLVSGFNPDDLMNMHFAVHDGWGKVIRGNFLFFSTQYRPLGGLYYLGLYDWFGMNSLPFRVVGISLIAANVGLLFALTRLLSGKVEAGIYAALVIAWHGNLAPLFYGSGNIYDVLGFTCWTAGLLWFVRCRQEGRLSLRQIAIFALLQICALNSKEFTATLPVVLLVTELLYHRRSIEWRSLSVSVVLSGMYAVGKVVGHDSLVAQEAYAPNLSLSAYTDSLRSVVNDLVYSSNWATPGNSAVCVLVLIATAALLRNRAMLTGCAIALFGTLPVMLITPRGLAAHYLAVGGLALWTGALVADLRERFARAVAASHFEDAYLQTATFAVLFSWWVLWHAPEVPYRRDGYAKTVRPIAQALDSVRKHPEWFADPKRRILIVSDAFGEGDWDTVFLSGLVMHRQDIQIEKLAHLRRDRPNEPLEPYDLYLHWDGSQLVAGEPPSPRHVTAP